MPPSKQAYSRIAIAALAMSLGYSVWALSPRLLGTPLPWDADGPFYSAILLGAGWLAGKMDAQVWRGYIPVWLGQVLALAILPLDRTANMLGSNAWWILGIAGTGVGSLMFVAGGYLAQALRRDSRGGQQDQ
ncbi:MAG: hypothetical protein ACOY9D_09415 [Pseudomonadota bacterium]